MNLLDLVFPRRCKLCGEMIDEGAVCFLCANNLEQASLVRTESLHTDNGTFECRYVFDYSNELVRKLLFALKRNADKNLHEFASHLYAKAIPDGFDGTVVALPRRKTNVRFYGYDHVRKPCIIMCENSDGKICFSNLVVRRGFSKDQKNLSAKQRKINAKGKYRIIKKDIPKNILLVDDVVTTANSVKSVIGEICKVRNDVNITVICLALRRGSSGKGNFEY